MSRRTENVFVEGQGIVRLKPLIRLNTAHVVVIPAFWVHTFCDPDDPRVTVEELDDEVGFTIRPFRGKLVTPTQYVMPLHGLSDG